MIHNEQARVGEYEEEGDIGLDAIEPPVPHMEELLAAQPVSSRSGPVKNQ